MTAKEVFGKGLSIMMERTGANTKKVALFTGISQRQMDRLANGESFPTTDKVLQKLARYFHVEESDILAFGLGLCGE